ncbi:MAG: MBL fold metallo-hydrolase [Muribaculaceae bacterium]|nr:MBL fold metallo-hydrolase [Muribaculaceae bacterium]
MRRKHLANSHLQPGLFDTFEDLAESGIGDFKIIPPDREAEIARLEAERRARAIDDMPPMQQSDHIFFMSFGSGSSGNCSYVGDRNCGFLIDAGIEARRVITDLRDNGIMPEQVKGIILTHDHHDHISQVYPLLRNYRHMKLYCTPRTLNGMLRRHNISRRIKDYHVAVYKEFPFTIGAFSITPFEVMHDGADNVGFFIEHGAQTLSVATDLGCISDRADFYLRQAQSLVLESNYDLHKLKTGSYPEHLKARIVHEKGHLDNRVSAEYVASIYSSTLRNVFLCHLSHDNNTPALALEAYHQALATVGITDFATTSIPFDAEYQPDSPRLAVIPLPRYERTPLFTL